MSPGSKSKPKSSSGRPTIEERARIKSFKRILQYTVVAMSFSVPTTFVAALLFDSLLIYYGFLICIPLYTSMLLIYHYMEEQRISIERSTTLFFSMSMISMVVLTYMAGGFGGAMISIYLVVILTSAMVAREKKAKYVFISFFVIYLIFLIGESFGIIHPIVTDPIIIKYSSAIIDLTSFLVMFFIIGIIAKNFKDSTKYYKLRSEKLSKMREKLEILVNRRTKQLRQSNKQLKKAQSELKKSNEELKKLDVKKNEFLSVASHELQTPLATIHGFSQLLKKGKILKNRKKTKEYVRLIESESDRLSKLVKEMLDLSRIELGTLKFKTETVDLKEFLDEINFQMKQEAKEKGLALKTILEKDLPKMSTDKEKLRQILINLISNSIKYTDKGTITIGAKKSGNLIEFSVADTGIGISKRDYKKIFKRFSKIQPSKGNRKAGTGLGLSICKEYVNLMGGKIWLKSRLGKGTTFYFTLPLKFKPPRKKP